MNNLGSCEVRGSKVPGEGHRFLKYGVPSAVMVCLGSFHLIHAFFVNLVVREHAKPRVVASYSLHFAFLPVCAASSSFSTAFLARVAHGIIVSFLVLGIKKHVEN